MTTIYLIRHAEAEGNLYRRIHGHYDSLVTVRGQKQIAELGKRFGGIDVDVVYSSDLTRTRVTAEAVAGAGDVPLFLTPQLREVDVGDWEDRTWGEVERFEPEQLYNFNNDPTKWRVNGCEDFYSLQRRMTEAIRAIAERHSGKTAAVVSHGSAIRAFLSGVMGVAPHEIQCVPHSDNTAVALLRYDAGKFGVDYIGDNSHLPRELSTFAHQKWWRENTTFDSTNLRFTPFDLKSGADAALYLDFRRDVYPWVGDADKGGDGLLETARNRAGADPRAVSLALIYDTPVGMVELDTKSGAAEKTGVIDYLYMVPEQRRTGIAVQLLGQAVSVFRSLGYEKLRLSVSEKNGQTLGFCSKYGFAKTGDYMGPGGRHLVLELGIKVG